MNVYNVEFAELPPECYSGTLATPAPLPTSIPIDKIMGNIVARAGFKRFCGCQGSELGLQGVVRAGAEPLVQGLQVPMLPSSDPRHLLVLRLGLFR